MMQQQSVFCTLHREHVIVDKHCGCLFPPSGRLRHVHVETQLNWYLVRIGGGHLLTAVFKLKSKCMVYT